jgi:hypothetical protein
MLRRLEAMTHVALVHTYARQVRDSDHGLFDAK